MQEILWLMVKTTTLDPKRGKIGLNMVLQIEMVTRLDNIDPPDLREFTLSRHLILY